MTTLLRDASTALRATGGRMTAQRRLILQTLDDLGGHPTADQVYQAAHRHDVALHPTTVYRTLGWLADAGLVNPRHLEPRGDRCEHYDPASPVEHHHFVCTRCGRVVEFAASGLEQIKQQFVAAHGVRITQASLTLHGLCAACAIAEPEEDA
jgi:Fe2+ or Zn2+ uptake regulation protein